MMEVGSNTYTFIGIYVCVYINIYIIFTLAICFYYFISPKRFMNDLIKYRLMDPTSRVSDPIGLG